MKQSLKKVSAQRIMTCKLEGYVEYADLFDAILQGHTLRNHYYNNDFSRRVVANIEKRKRVPVIYDTQEFHHSPSCKLYIVSTIS